MLGNGSLKAALTPKITLFQATSCNEYIINGWKVERYFMTERARGALSRGVKFSLRIYQQPDSLYVMGIPSAENN